MTTLYQNRYRIERTLGSGGFGEVYLAADTAANDRAVAVKTLRLAIDDPGLLTFATTTFRQEFATLTRLSHPHICRVFDYGIDPATQECYFSAEYVDGKDIWAWATAADTAAVEALFVQTLRAVGYLHSHGILHGDIKPANCLVTLANGAPFLKLVDFGLSQAIGTTRAIPTGTLKFMAPEQLLREFPADPRTDLYAAGLLFYQLFARTYPFPIAT
ncbi:MAG: serine/threonine protein kinase, partial [Deltaproteobacteria bacterium]|nr:serine/threonine protein kinase [Deltaproteobacteria bacterium]